jgi:RNA polymerase sigma factor (sigma-70 family)
MAKKRWNPQALRDKLQQISGGTIALTDLEIGRLRYKLRFRVAYEVGFACADLDDLVQETLRRFLHASQEDKLRTSDAAGAFVNGICRNVIFEYRRRLHRDAPMPEIIPEPPAHGLPETERFELRQSLDEAMKQLSARDRLLLRSFYLEEQPIEEILELAGLTLENFRVLLCRAKKRLRQIYCQGLQYGAMSGH